MQLWPPCLFSATGGFFFVASLQRSNCEDKKYNQPFSFLVSQLTAPSTLLIFIKNKRRIYPQRALVALLQEKIIKKICNVLQRKSHLYIPFLGIAPPPSQFPHSCVCERLIYSQDRSTYFPAAERIDRLIVGIY